jgi:hypothetical protein
MNSMILLRRFLSQFEDLTMTGIWLVWGRLGRVRCNGPLKVQIGFQIYTDRTAECSLKIIPGINLDLIQQREGAYTVAKCSGDRDHRQRPWCFNP